MRHIPILVLLASPAAAWEFSPSPICTLTHRTPAAEVTVTYDASLPEYTITITLTDQVWPQSDIFGMAFFGNRPLAIQTDRHQRSADGRSLTVVDRGFGNVLNGLAFNDTAIARSGGRDIPIPLDGIKPAIAAFRACPADNLS